MALKRQQIFAQLQQLATAKLGSLVNLSSYFAIVADPGKASLVLTPGNEQVLHQQDDNRQLARKMLLTASLKLQSEPSSVLSKLDPLCHLLELAWLRPEQSVLWQNLRHKGTDLSFTQDNNQVVAQATLKFELEFFTETEAVVPDVQLREIYLGYGGQGHELIARIADNQPG